MTPDWIRSLTGVRSANVRTWKVRRETVAPLLSVTLKHRATQTVSNISGIGRVSSTVAAAWGRQL